MKDYDSVDNPAHYNKGGVECIDAIRGSMSEEHSTSARNGQGNDIVFCRAVD